MHIPATPEIPLDTVAVWVATVVVGVVFLALWVKEQPMSPGDEPADREW